MSNSLPLSGRCILKSPVRRVHAVAANAAGTENNITVCAGTKEAAQAGDATTTEFRLASGAQQGVRGLADEPVGRDLDQHSWPNSGKEVHGPQVSRDANLEGHSAAGGKRAAERTRNEGQEAGQVPPNSPRRLSLRRKRNRSSQSAISSRAAPKGRGDRDDEAGERCDARRT